MDNRDLETKFKDAVGAAKPELSKNKGKIILATGLMLVVGVPLPGLALFYGLGALGGTALMAGGDAAKKGFEGKPPSP